MNGEVTLTGVHKYQDEPGVHYVKHGLPQHTLQIGKRMRELLLLKFSP